MTQQIRESREQAFKEITIWADGAATVNHTYLLNGDKAVAYIRYGTSEPFWFKTPIRIDKRGRKFEQVDSMPFYSSFNVFTPGNVKEVLGSKGAKYIVNLDDNTCTCPGYTYRGDCKHIKELDTA
jgi:hypothetical protein